MNPFWIKIEGVRLAITPRPRGRDWLDDDIRFLQRAGVDVVVSALTPAEVEELGLLEEGHSCQSNGLEFLSFPIEDRSVPPSLNEFDGLLNFVTAYLRNGKAVGVHCRAGIRMALGARPDNVYRMVIGQGMRLALTGVMVGLVSSFVVSRILTSLLFGISGADSLVYVGVSLLML